MARKCQSSKHGLPVTTVTRRPVTNESARAQDLRIAMVRFAFALNITEPEKKAEAGIIRRRMGSQKVKWRPHGESNPGYRRERAVS